MKKHLIAVLAACSILSIHALQAAEEQPQAFEDQPALTRAERAALLGAKAVGVVPGALVGRKVGGVAGALAGGVGGGAAGAGLGGIAEGAEGAAAGGLIGVGLGGGTGAIAGSLVGIGLGGVAGYRGAGSAAIYALAKLHGVSYRVEAISQYYNINIPQYWQILAVASLQNPDELIQAIDDVFPLRFGSDWNKRLEQLFKKYGKRAESLLKHSTLTRKKDERDFIRMIELGAAMANLYYGTKPNPKNTFASAKQLYEELGLLK